MAKRRSKNTANASVASSSTSTSLRGNKKKKSIKQKKLVLDDPNDAFLVKAMTSNKTPKISNCGDKLDFPKATRLPPRYTSRAAVAVHNKTMKNKESSKENCSVGSNDNRSVGSRKRNSRVTSTTNQASTTTTSTQADASNNVSSRENAPVTQQLKQKRKVLVDLPLDQEDEEEEEGAIEELAGGVSVERGERGRRTAMRLKRLQPSVKGSTCTLETVKEGDDERKEPIAVQLEIVQDPLVIAVDSMDCSSDECSLELEANNEPPPPPHARQPRDTTCQEDTVLHRSQPPLQCEEDLPTNNVLLRSLRESNVDNPVALAAMLSSQPPSPPPSPSLTLTGTTIGGERLDACASLDGSELTMRTFDDDDEMEDTNEPPVDVPTVYATQSPYFPPTSRSQATTPSTVATTPCQQFHSPRRTNISSATKSARQGCLDILQGRRLSDPRDNSNGSESDNESLASVDVDPKRNNRGEMMSPLTQEMFPSKHRPFSRPNVVEDGLNTTIIKLDEPPATEPKQIFFEYDGQLIPHPILPPGWDIHISKTKQRPFYTHPDHGTSWHCPVITPLCPAGEQLESTTKPVHLDETKEVLRNIETAETESLTTATDVTSLGSSPGEKSCHSNAHSQPMHNTSNENDFNVSTISGEVNTLGTMRRAVTMEHADIALLADSDSELLDDPLTAENSPGVTDISPTRDNADVLDDGDSSSDEEIAVLTQRNASKGKSETVSLFPSQRIHCADDIQSHAQSTPGNNEDVSYHHAAEQTHPLKPSATKTLPTPMPKDQATTSGVLGLCSTVDYAADDENIGSPDDSDVTASGGAKSQSTSPKELYEEVVLKNAAHKGSPNLVRNIDELAKGDTVSSKEKIRDQSTLAIPESEGRSPTAEEDCPNDDEDDFPNDDGEDDDESHLEESLGYSQLRGIALEGRFDDAMSQVGSLQDFESTKSIGKTLRAETNHDDTHAIEEVDNLDIHDEVKDVTSPRDDFGGDNTESEDVSESESEGSGPCPEDVDVRSVDSVSTLGTHKRSLSMETFLSKLSIRILNPPHPICHLQRLDDLIAAASLKRGRIYGRAESKLIKPAKRTRRN